MRGVFPAVPVFFSPHTFILRERGLCFCCALVYALLDIIGAPFRIIIVDYTIAWQNSAGDTYIYDGHTLLFHLSIIVIYDTVISHCLCAAPLRELFAATSGFDGYIISLYTTLPRFVADRKRHIATLSRRDDSSGYDMAAFPGLSAAGLPTRADDITGDIIAVCRGSKKAGFFLNFHFATREPFITM